VKLLNETLTGGRAIVLAASVIAAIAIACQGCATTSSNAYDHGRSYNALFAAQAVNPHAPADPAFAASLPGDVADRIYNERYVKSLTEDKGETQGSTALPGLSSASP